MFKRLAQAAKFVVSVSPANRASAGEVEGAAVDTLGNDAAAAILNTGTIGAATSVD